MRHKKDTFKLNRNSSHRRCMLANMLKALILNGRIETTVPKAKQLRRYADRLVTKAKRNTLATRRQVIGELMVRFNPLNSKQRRAAKEGDLSSFNGDRRVIDMLFNEIAPRFAGRQGGYTRIMRTTQRVGDNAQLCVIEYLND